MCIHFHFYSKFQLFHYFCIIQAAMQHFFDLVDTMYHSISMQKKGFRSKFAGIMILNECFKCLEQLRIMCTVIFH